MSAVAACLHYLGCATEGIDIVIDGVEITGRHALFECFEYSMMVAVGGKLFVAMLLEELAILLDLRQSAKAEFGDKQTCARFDLCVSLIGVCFTEILIELPMFLRYRCAHITVELAECFLLCGIGQVKVCTRGPAAGFIENEASRV